MRFLLDDFEKIVCAVIFIVMTVLGFANVVVRYLTSYSFAATQEVLLNGFLLMTVFGAAIAARRGEHLAVTLLSDILPAGARKAVIFFATALSVGLVLRRSSLQPICQRRHLAGARLAGLVLFACRSLRLSSDRGSADPVRTRRCSGWWRPCLISIPAR